MHLVMGTCTYLSIARSHVVQLQSNGLQTGRGPPRILNLQPYPRLTLSACSSKGGSALISLLPDLLPLSPSLPLSLSLHRDFWSQSTPSRLESQSLSLPMCRDKTATHLPLLLPPSWQTYLSQPLNLKTHIGPLTVDKSTLKPHSHSLALECDKETVLS